MTDSEIISALASLSTATLTTILLKKGLRNVWMRGTRPLVPSQGRVAGRAFTLRFVPAREDLATPASWESPTSTRGAVEAMTAGSIVVIDSAGINDAGVLGDILCARMKKRQVKALVTDGSLRDVEGVRAVGLPAWCSGPAAPPAVAALTFVGWQQPVACGGVAIFPDDFIVADDDGAVVIPQAMAQEVVRDALAQERLENWIMSEVDRGAGLMGLYPPNEKNRERFEAYLAELGNNGGKK